jgi:hypothetical protein
MNNIIAYTILLIIVMYVLKSNIEKFGLFDGGNTPGLSIGNTTAQPPSNDMPSIGNIPGLSIGNTTAQPTSSILDALSASMGNTSTSPSLPTGGILGGIMGNPSPSPASTNDLEAKVAAFCKSVQ